MMTDDARRKVFWLLKKYSSYTAWKALGSAYAAFTDAWMEAMRRADFEDAEEQSWLADHTKSILDGRIAFEKGLPRLRRGDRNVWKNNAEGALNIAVDGVIFAHQIMNPEEFVFDWMKNKDQVIALEKQTNLQVLGLYSVFERPRSEAPAYWSPDLVFDPIFGPFNVPHNLPSVPTTASPAFTVDTGEGVPVDGIYEPEWVNASPTPSTGLFDKIKSAISTKAAPDAPAVEPQRLANIGCMNYLLAGARAPSYKDHELEQPHAVTWRLIWKDERYLDGTIPPEEAQYLAEPAEPDILRLRCEATHPCPRDGYWHTPAQANSRRHFKAGELMPDLRTDYGATIWEWDGDDHAA